MLKITIFNDTEQHLEADFDVVELVGGKEIRRTVMSPSDNPGAFQLVASNQALLIVPRDTPCPQMEVPESGDIINLRRRIAE
jgi:hypothetical protein